MECDGVNHLLTLSKTKKHIIAQVMLLNSITSTFIISNNVNLFKDGIVMSVVIDYDNEEDSFIRNFKKNELSSDGVDLTNINLLSD